jgi:hypothetical protein
MDRLNAFWVGCLKLLMNGLFLWTHFVEIALENSLLEILLSLGENLIFFLEEIHLWFAALIRKPKRGE